MADIGNIDMDRQKRIDESYKKAVEYEQQLGKTSIEEFFDDLEKVLRKHFNDEWTFHYKDSGHPLQIYSEALASMWDTYMDDEAELVGGNDEKEYVWC